MLFTVSGAFPLLSGLIMLPFYIHYLSEKSLGVFSLYFAITLFFQGIIHFAVEQKSALDYVEHSNDPIKRRIVISTNIIFGIRFSLIIGFLIAIVHWLFGDLINLVLGLEMYPYIWMVYITAFANSIFKQYTYLLIYSSRPWVYFSANLFNLIVTILISIWGVKTFGDSVIGPMLGRFFSGLLILIPAFYYFSTHIGWKYESSEVTKIIRYLWPIMIVIIFTWIASYSDRFVILRFMSLDQVGVYDFIIKCTLGIEVVLGGLINVIYPRLFVFLNKTDSSDVKSIQEKSNQFFYALMGGGLFSIVFTLLSVPLLVNFFIDKQPFIDSLKFLPLLSAAFLFRVFYHQYHGFLLFNKLTYLLPVNLIVSSIIQLICSLPLIHFWGIDGAVITFIIGKFISGLIFYLSVRKHVQIKLNLTKQIFFPTVVILVAGVFYFAGFYGVYFNALFSVIIVMISILFYFNEVKNTKIVKLLKSYSKSKE